VDAVVEQLQAMQRLLADQLKALGVQTPAPNGVVAAPQPVAAKAAPAAAEGGAASALTLAVGPKTDLTPAQRAHIEDLVARTVARTSESKRMTQQYRPVLADPRVAAGFRGEWKEMVYPITCVRAQGSRLWDADGNEYIDILNGFGQTAFGHSPGFVVEA